MLLASADIICQFITNDRHYRSESSRADYTLCSLESRAFTFLASRFWTFDTGVIPRFGHGPSIMDNHQFCFQIDNDTGRPDCSGHSLYPLDSRCDSNVAPQRRVHLLFRSYGHSPRLGPYTGLFYHVGKYAWFLSPVLLEYEKPHYWPGCHGFLHVPWGRVSAQKGRST